MPTPSSSWRVHQKSRRVAVTWTVATVGFLAVGGCLLYATAGEVGRLTRVTTPTPREVTTDLIVRNAKDEQGRRASFRILLFSDEFRWRLSSSNALVDTSSTPVFTDEMKKVLNNAEEIITVGASSEEIPRGLTVAEGRAREEGRAGKRAERIAAWVRGALSKPLTVRKLNVGHHKPTGSADTSDQRRMVIILVMGQDVGANIDEALRAAMERESERAPIFKALLTQYSLSSGKSFTWVG